MLKWIAISPYSKGSKLPADGAAIYLPGVGIMPTGIYDIIKDPNTIHALLGLPNSLALSDAMLARIMMEVKVDRGSLRRVILGRDADTDDEAGDETGVDGEDKDGTEDYDSQKTESREGRC